MPALFLGHGNPLNALERNPWTSAWAALGRALPRPRAVLCISAHWFTRGLRVTAAEFPRTIHDFGGFPEELFAVRYPVPGSPELAERVVELLAPDEVELDEGWGLDHGAWSLLLHLFPEADVPVVQLSLDGSRDASEHHELGRALAPLRDEGVLVLGSGNVVHDLYDYSWARDPVPAPDWARRFEGRLREQLLAGDHAGVVALPDSGRDAASAVPSPEHFLPLACVLGTRGEGEPVDFPVDGYDGGTVSMLGVRISAP
ncbi:MAG: 4,5-DOPA dioxygenase extradiol [Planctomycetes bacterium]|nr:4,5-DOPA dioxygenase extradiol [Planctomycetota bacterium]